MLEQARDLLAEVEELDRFLDSLAPGDWSAPTAFRDWTPWDVVAHLHFYDRVSRAALEGREAFGARRRELVRALAAGASNRELARRELGALPPDALRARWREAAARLARELGARDPRERLPWFGPDMGVRMFTTARLMETWAHGQEIYDLLGATREPTDRLRHVAEIGVRTFGWTFRNRGLEPPGPPPHVRLRLPSGAVAEWNGPGGADAVIGDALDFAQVVTQTRNVADTGLEVRGPVATAWMAIAQCFAGPPADPPKPGERLPRPRAG